MGFSTYADLARNRAVRRMLAVSTLIRVPMWASGVVVTLHVVISLGHSYADAGVVDMVLSIALAVSSPWRGRRLDKVGLRATIAPSLVVGVVCWSIAPWVGYWPLVALVGVAGLFAVPSFSIVRQVLIGAVPDHQRTAVLSVDSVFVELTFMVGPVLGVLAASYLPTSVALLICQLAVVLGGLALWIDNPALGHPDEPATEAHRRLRSWVTPTVVVVLLIAITSTALLTSEDLGTVAALRHMHHTGSIGWVLAVWGVGSALGGIVYGALRRHPPAAVLLALLAASTAGVAIAHSQPFFTVLLLLSGVFCAPTVTATVDEISRAVPARARGEAMGWHGSAMTLGGAAGAPFAGAAIDAGGWAHGFAVPGLVGLALALVAVGWRVTRPLRAGAGEAETALEVPLVAAVPVGSGGAVHAEPGEDLARGLAPVERVEVQARGAGVE